MRAASFFAITLWTILRPFPLPSGVSPPTSAAPPTTSLIAPKGLPPAVTHAPHAIHRPTGQRTPAPEATASPTPEHGPLPHRAKHMCEIILRLAVKIYWKLPIYNHFFRRFQVVINTCATVAEPRHTPTPKSSSFSPPPAWHDDGGMYIVQSREGRCLAAFPVAAALAEEGGHGGRWVKRGGLCV